MASKTAAASGSSIPPWQEKSDTRLYVFPDWFPHGAGGDEASRRQYTRVFELMDGAGRAERQLSPEEHAEIRDVLTTLASRSTGDVIGAYAARRLIVLDWQAGRLTASAASNRLMELAASQDGAQGQLTRAMALTIDVRARDIGRFRSGLRLLKASETPEFGSFLSEFARYLIQEYILEGVKPEEVESGKPKPEEYRRSVVVCDLLETQIFDAADAYLQGLQTAEGHDSGSPTNASDYYDGRCRANIVLALKQTTEYMRAVLGRRLYLDISERTTSVLLPRSLELWERAVQLLDGSSGTYLELPQQHRDEIKVFREQVVPHLMDLQNSQHLLRDFGPVIARQEGKIEKLDREELTRLAEEQSLRPRTKGIGRAIVLCVTGAFLVMLLGLLCYRHFAAESSHVRHS